MKVIFIIMIAVAQVANAMTIELAAEADNTLFEDLSGQLSNGSGPHLFAGKIRNGRVRRALIKFDVSAIPAGAEIISVNLSMHMSRTIVAVQTFELFRMTSAWGEAGSDSGSPGGQGVAAHAGDATWMHGFYDSSLWQQAGGDFDPIASASAVINAVGYYSWNSESMLENVLAWHSGKSLNAGWLLKGVEFLPGETAKRFDSREHDDINLRPKLTIVYNLPPEQVPLLSTAMLIWFVLSFLGISYWKRSTIFNRFDDVKSDDELSGK